MGLEQRLRDGLKAALRERDLPAVSALRTALAAVSNAEAVPGPDRYVEPEPNRLNEVPRRELTEDEIVSIVAAEAAERRTAITEYEALGRPGQAERLRAELATLQRFL